MKNDRNKAGANPTCLDYYRGDIQMKIQMLHNVYADKENKKPIWQEGDILEVLSTHVTEKGEYYYIVKEYQNMPCGVFQQDIYKSYIPVEEAGVRVPV